MSYSDGYNGEDIGQYYADQEHAIREANSKPSSRHHKVKGKKYGQTKGSKPKDINLKMDDFNALSELAKEVHDLRQHKKYIEERIKDASDKIRAAFLKYGIQSITLDNYIVTDSTKTCVRVDRYRLEHRYPEVFNDCTYVCGSPALYVKVRNKNDNDE